MPFQLYVNSNDCKQSGHLSLTIHVVARTSMTSGFKINSVSYNKQHNVIIDP